ncbi:hypothetical protein [Nonomuraea sp. SBT364]|uniref:hypothetical protein n=1 Tax=Nonomuraea sp. SBT364 TaxID=1580530 RepID=UPI0012E2550C|nr:hypothetical protein [Nonomuraea sp. SBT364]
MAERRIASNCLTFGAFADIPGAASSASLTGATPMVSTAPPPSAHTASTCSSALPCPVPDTSVTVAGIHASVEPLRPSGTSSSSTGVRSACSAHLR